MLSNFEIISPKNILVTTRHSKEGSKRKTLLLFLRAANNGNIRAKTAFLIERSKSVEGGNSDDIIALQVHSMNLRCTSKS